MTALLDNKVECMQLGESGNEEYGWSSDIEAMLTQFHFQLTRGASVALEDKYQELLARIFAKNNTNTTNTKNNNTNTTNNNTNIQYVTALYKLIGYTRDIIHGKGEAQLTYMLISGLYKFSQSPACDPNDQHRLIAMATGALESLVRISRAHPYGSWKDIKYFCNYHIATVQQRASDRLKHDPLFTAAVNLICGQLQCDENAPVKSLVAKWIPREKSAKFGWLTEHLAVQYYGKWIGPDLSPAQHKVAVRKCLTHFRQLVSRINKTIHTPQIAQCNGTWSDIDFTKDVTSITLRKQGRAFQGIDRQGQDRDIMLESADRQQCSANYKAYVQQCKTGASIAKGRRVSVTDFVKDAISATDPTQQDCLNAQWADNGVQNGALKNCIAMIDTSQHHTDLDPLYSAIGMGIRIAEKSKLGKRVLTFNATPSWITLNDCPDFVSSVKKIHSASWGPEANFAAALDLILDTAIENEVSPDEMKDMTLVILSDMQINVRSQERTKSASTENPLSKQNIMFNRMKTKYAAAGLKSVYMEPYTLPHIVFWNLRPTSGFPSLTTTENTSMMSGNNPALINAFCRRGLSMLQELTPWNFLMRELANPRYDPLENIVKNLYIV